MKKSIYHATDENGGYKALDIQKNERGDIFIAIAQGTKGDKESRQRVVMKLTEDEAAGLMVSLQRMLIFS